MSNVVTLNLTKRFATRTRPSERVVAVAGMFGIGLDAERTFTVLDGLTLRLRRGAVVYVTGPSGSGKSVLLSEIERQLRHARRPARRIVSLAEITWPERRALVDCFEQPLDETLRLLSVAGLNDAFLFLRRPAELSDGQRYRLRLALALAARAEVVLIDEFCSTLDRVTARVIAYQVRRHAPRTGTTFIVATAHDDLLEDLRPDVYIEKRFGGRIAVFDARAQQLPARCHGECTVLRNVRIEPAERAAWDELKAFHYRGHALPPRSHLFAATVPAREISHLTSQIPEADGPATKISSVRSQISDRNAPGSNISDLKSQIPEADRPGRNISDVRSQSADREGPRSTITNVRSQISDGHGPGGEISNLRSEISHPTTRRVIAVIVYGFPALENRPRKYASGGRYLAKSAAGRRRAAERLNREVRTIARVVVDPQYRGLGLAVRLVRETMPLVGTPYVEALAVMGQVNPFFERAGLVRYHTPSPPGAERLKAALAHCRIPPAVAGAPRALAARLQHLEPSRRALLLSEIRRWLRRYRGARSSGRRHASQDVAIDDLRLLARHLFGNPVYYLWRNPNARPPALAIHTPGRLGG